MFASGAGLLKKEGRKEMGIKIKFCEPEITKLCFLHAKGEGCLAKYDFVLTVQCQERDKIFKAEDERLRQSVKH